MLTNKALESLPNAQGKMSKNPTNEVKASSQFGLFNPKSLDEMYVVVKDVVDKLKGSNKNPSNEA